MSELEKYFTPLAIEKMQMHGIDLKKLGSRLIVLDDIDEAFSFKVRGRKTIYPQWAYNKAKENGISRQTLYHRVQIQGLQLEEAVTKKVL